MNQIVNSFTAFARNTRTTAYLGTADCGQGYFVVDAAAIIPINPQNFVRADYNENNGHMLRRRERLSADPRKRQALERARRRIANEIDSASYFSLAKLRLQAGLSQAQLAALIGTRQPGIARLEKGQTDPTASTIEKLSIALGVPPEKVLGAFLTTKNHLAK